ncbi:MAG: Zn-ribbon containing protein [Candidatus Woesearchaeota archaeon]|nr:Zn-ribbon containing protein [Candidatus Woesearchaeota archaeon]
MPHKCVKCSTTYENDDPVVIDGCACGAKVFLYIRSTEGKYTLDLDALFTGDARTDDGKYDIDVDAAFKGM